MTKESLLTSGRGQNRRDCCPRRVGAILDEMLRGDSPFAVAYRNRFFPDTHLGVDVKVFSTKPGRMPVGSFSEGYFTRSDEDKFLIIEKASEKKVKTEPRNAHIYVGDCVNVNVRTDGVVYPTFRYGQLYSGKISFKDFCLAAAQELLTIARLGEGGSEGVAS